MCSLPAWQTQKETCTWGIHRQQAVWVEFIFCAIPATFLCWIWTLSFYRKIWIELNLHEPSQICNYKVWQGMCLFSAYFVFAIVNSKWLPLLFSRQSWIYGEFRKMKNLIWETENIRLKLKPYVSKVKVFYYSNAGNSGWQTIFSLHLIWQFGISPIVLWKKLVHLD